MGVESGVPILALNSGSSSLKFGLFLVGEGVNRLLVSGSAALSGDQHGGIEARNADGEVLACDSGPIGAAQTAIARIADLLVARGFPAPVAVGHRIVHGGALCRRHTAIDAAVMQRLEAATAFAPLHVPPALALVRGVSDVFPALPQVACLDTAFHVGLPDVARVLPIPRELTALGIERYGFHGLSCESILQQLGTGVPRRLVIAHLGNGASVTAVADGRSIDTSMGLTPSGGVIMGTRCGDIDPGVFAYLTREHHYDAARLEAMIDQQSGLRGISGVSSDMRQLHALEASNQHARLAIAMFCYCVRKQIAAMAAALGGIDLLVLTGGIGENDAAVRAQIRAGLAWLGADPEPLASGCEGTASASDHGSAGRPRCLVRVLPSQEDAQIARHTWQLAMQPPGA